VSHGRENKEWDTTRRRGCDNDIVGYEADSIYL
jgi:hypothetical protein